MEEKDIEDILKERLLDGIRLCGYRLQELERLRKSKYPLVLDFKGAMIGDDDNPDVFLILFPDRKEFWSDDLFASIENLLKNQMSFYQKCYDEGIPDEIISS